MIDPETFIRLLLNGRRTGNSTNQNHGGVITARTTLDRFTSMTHPFLFGSYYHYTYNTNDTRMETNRTMGTTTTNRRRNRKLLRVQDIVSQFDVVLLSKRRKVDMMKHHLHSNDMIKSYIH